MTKYMIFKNDVHVATASSPEEADEVYAAWEADEIREYEDDAWMNMLSDD